MCYNPSMKLFMLLFLISAQSIAGCRYEMLEQNGKYFAIQKVMGDLPPKDLKVEKNLKPGINDIVIPNPENDEELENIKKSRIKVRFQSENKEAVEKYLKIRCP